MRPPFNAFRARSVCKVLQDPRCTMSPAQAIDDVHGSGDLGLVVQLGRFEAERDLTTIYRLMFRLVNPATVVVKTTDYWRKFHDTGSWEMMRMSPTEIQGVLTGWGVVDHAL